MTTKAGKSETATYSLIEKEFYQGSSRVFTALLTFSDQGHKCALLDGTEDSLPISQAA
jgi:hypothetical protein